MPADVKELIKEIVPSCPFPSEQRDAYSWTKVRKTNRGEFTDWNGRQSLGNPKQYIFVIV